MQSHPPIRLCPSPAANGFNQKTGSLLHEVLTVLAIMIGISSGLFCFFSHKDEQSENANRFQLTRLRSAIDGYHQFTGEYPKDLNDLTGFHPDENDLQQPTPFTFVRELPCNALTESAEVLIISNSPAILNDVTNRAGWLYNPETGEVWIDHETQYFE